MREKLEMAGIILLALFFAALILLLTGTFPGI